MAGSARQWKSLWQKRLDNWNNSHEKLAYPDFALPTGSMRPIGYLCQQHSVRLDRPVQAYDKWVQRIPAIYREAVLSEPAVRDAKKDFQQLADRIMTHMDQAAA